MALNSLYCADVPLSNYSLTHSLTQWRLSKTTSATWMLWAGCRLARTCQKPGQKVGFQPGFRLDRF